jgi:hypothetical protein
VRTLAPIAWGIQFVAALVALVAAAIEVESIVVTGPILTISGLFNAVMSSSSASWAKLFAGLSAPLVCALIAACIGVFDWNPDEAEGPIFVIMGLYLFILLPIAAFAFNRGYDPQAKATAELPRLQFSMKSMLIAMTAFCFAIALWRFLLGVSRGDDIFFDAYALIVVMLCGAVIWRFAVYRRRALKLGTIATPIGTGTTTTQDLQP